MLLAAVCLCSVKGSSLAKLGSKSGANKAGSAAPQLLVKEAAAIGPLALPRILDWTSCICHGCSAMTACPVCKPLQALQLLSAAPIEAKMDQHMTPWCTLWHGQFAQARCTQKSCEGADHLQSHKLIQQHARPATTSSSLPCCQLPSSCCNDPTASLAMMAVAVAPIPMTMIRPPGTACARETSSALPYRSCTSDRVVEGG